MISWRRTFDFFCLGEFGDYDPADHQAGYLDDFNMLEDEVRVCVGKKGEKRINK